MKTNKPLVSVIMNCYNGEKFLEKAVRSVLNQKYKNWELIFFDNRSYDNSKKIFLNISKKDKRLKYFKSKKFVSLSEARNIAIKKSKGEFIAFLDVDDYWRSVKLKKQIKVLNENKHYSLIYSNCYILKDNGKKEIFAKKKLPQGNITKELLHNYKIGILTTIVRSKILKKFLFNKKYQIIGDFDLFIKISSKFKIASIQEPLAFYRMHGSNFSRKKINLMINELETWLLESKNLKIMKKYSFQGVIYRIQILKIKKYFLLNERLKAFYLIIKKPFSYKKLRYLSLLFLSKSMIKRIFYY
ncbi:MAG: glycosyltransferase family 2 protein [Pelagibacteraceae bacterium]